VTGLRYGANAHGRDTVVNVVVAIGDEGSAGADAAAVGDPLHLSLAPDRFEVSAAWRPIEVPGLDLRIVRAQLPGMTRLDTSSPAALP